MINESKEEAISEEVTMEKKNLKAKIDRIEKEKENKYLAEKENEDPK